MSALDQSMLQMLTAHGACYFSINVNGGYPDDPEQVWYNADMQWIDESKPCGRGIANGSGDSIPAALSRLIECLAIKRGSSAISDQALPMGEAA